MGLLVIPVSPIAPITPARPPAETGTLCPALPSSRTAGIHWSLGSIHSCIIMQFFVVVVMFGYSAQPVGS